ncbi:MAG TPA: hypothetical protein VFW93_17975 [Aquabacterium sp.]|uniref:hypothetical protein n=1 Tax=Aquabacterium sp. TaxID=1872578 RepID=UPI002E313907|nr:hypothetical protein [Aquabacterium sp.]HEX5358095.1 hypothetical protein [Aquabacterium sp.]
MRLFLHIRSSLSRHVGKRRLASLALALSLAPGITLASSEGIQFSCDQSLSAAIRLGMTRYLQELGIPDRLYRVTTDTTSGQITYTLASPEGDHSTLDFHERAGYDVGEETLSLPQLGRPDIQVRTVSRKEIALALMQRGRLTVFSAAACDVQALKDQVELRQTIVAWTEHLHWVWPDGGAASWNKRYWHDGTPWRHKPLQEALLDAFTHQRQYAIGCYTATKLVLLQGVTDYYHRVRANANLSTMVLRRVWQDGDPLVNIEPGDMWFFEEDFDPREQGRPGKLMKIQYNVAPRNFVPGDWAYIVNTDANTHHKTGYEGSNALYLGRNRFDDYYDDHHHAYSYEEKLGEVYQWRHGVFSRSRDAARIQPLSASDFERLGLRPAQGGLVKGYRVVPFQFGYEALPAIPVGH